MTKYECAWKKWRTWTSGKSEIAVMPADPFHVAWYMNHVIQTSKTLGAVRAAYNGIAWAHRMNGYKSPTEDQFEKLTMKGCERILCKPVIKSLPLTSHIVKKVVDAYLCDPISIDFYRLPSL